MNPHALGMLASRRSYPLYSSFRPTYNMAVNLIDRYGRGEAREILERSFAQFQADSAVVDVAQTVKSNQEALRQYAEAMNCHLGDFREYSRIRRELTDLEGKSNKGSHTPHAVQKKRADQIDSWLRSAPDMALFQLADRHNCETPCNRTGLSSMGGQVAMGTWGCETKPSPRGIPCPAAC